MILNELHLIHLYKLTLFKLILVTTMKAFQVCLYVIIWQKF